ncbi:hypothetical protein AB0J82_07670 [Asanoa sp. NPDC049518]|uniref:hypothetical protein n=1 Tax=unclassified Asanoa TaxID=2685164 RepID=UPI00342FA732
MAFARISDAVRELAFEPTLPPDEALDRYYAPDYTHRADGEVLDRAAFAEMVAGMRARIARGTVTVLDELQVGSTYAERHVYDVTMTDGTELHREIYFFAEYAPDGRFRSVNETGFDVP